MEQAGVIEQLQAIGMSGYEAKAYVALVAAGGPLNGYEAAKRSGVPRSTVYETLAKLGARGGRLRSPNRRDDRIHRPSAGLAPVAVEAGPHGSARCAFDDPSGDRDTPGRPPRPPPPRSGVRDEAASDLVAGAREDLFLSVWPDEREALKPLLHDAVRRGVHASVISFGPDDHPVGHSYPHRFSEPAVVLERVGAQLLVVAADRAAVLIAGSLGDDMWGTFCDDPAVVLVAVEYVRHDIAMQVLVDRIGADEVDALWNTDPELLRLQTGIGAPRLSARIAAMAGDRPAGSNSVSTEVQSTSANKSGSLLRRRR